MRAYLEIVYLSYDPQQYLSALSGLVCLLSQNHRCRIGYLAVVRPRPRSKSHVVTLSL